MYLHNGFDIPADADLLLLDSEYWNGYSKSNEYLTEKKK